MKKRVKVKTMKRTNIERHELLFQEISKHFTIVNKSFGSGYFLFSLGSHSVCHFEIKELPEWYFGIWLNDKGFQIFGEHDDLIDKFKPSRTYISHEDDLTEFLKQVKDISKNPKLYFVDSLTGNALIDFKEHGEPEERWYSGYQVIRKYNDKTKLWDIIERDTTITQESYVENKYNEHQEEKRKKKDGEEADRKYAFNFFAELPNLFKEIQAVGITDKNKHGWIYSPRYDIRIIVSPEVDQETLSKLFDEWEKLIIKKNYSDERKTYEHGFSLVDCYDDMKDLKESDYVFKKSKDKN